MLNLHTPVSEAYRKSAEYKRVKAMFENIVRNPEEKLKFFQRMKWYDKEGNPTKRYLEIAETVTRAEQIEQDFAKAR